MSPELEQRLAQLEARIAALESDNDVLKIELHCTQSIVNCMENQRIPWNLSYVEVEAYKAGIFHWLPVKKYPTAERNALIGLMYQRGLTVEEIAVELFARNFKHPKGGLVRSGVIEKVIKGGGHGEESAS